MKFLRSKKTDLILQKIYEKSKVKRFFQFLLGSFIVAGAFNLFFSPNNLVPGGMSGASVILNSLFGWENSLVILVGSGILLIASYFLLGWEKTRGSILGSLLFPVCVKLTSNIGAYIDIDSSQLLLTTLFGAVLYGFGAGMIFKAGYTSGGTDILNQILSKYLHISIGNSILLSDGLIVFSSAFVFGINKLMYSLIILYIVSFITDRVILGISDSKAFYIITDEEEKVKDYILKYLNHGVTVFNAKGGYKKEKQTVLMCVLPTKEYYKLKEGLHEIDPDSFFVVTDAYEVFGGE